MDFLGKRPPTSREAAKLQKQEARSTKKAARQADKQRVRANIKVIADHLGTITKIDNAAIVAYAAKLVRDDEEILFAGAGKESDSDLKAILVATDRRIIIVAIKTISYSQTDVPYSEIDRIDVGTSWRGNWVTVFSGSQETGIEKSIKDFNPLRVIVRERQAAAHAATAPTVASTPVTAAPGGAEEVRKLAELHAQGILSDAEFAAAKAKALGL